MNARITAFLFASFLVLIIISSASAQAQRTFVSALGSDSNPCGRTTPCRTFAQALAGTNAGGEVIVLDSGGFGPVTITRSVSIIAPAGVYAGISVFSGDGIDINAGPSDEVILRGLTINNQGATGNGIVFSTGAALHVEDCSVSGFSSSASGLLFVPGGHATLEVEDSSIRDNSFGIYIAPAAPGGQALVTIEHTRLERNGDSGLMVAQGLSLVTVRNSVASGNNNGFVAGSASCELNIESCVASNNYGSAILSHGVPVGGTVRVCNSTVTGNNIGLGVSNTTAMLLSRGNNTVEGNYTANFAGVIGSYSAK
jgi:hypothetical protein